MKTRKIALNDNDKGFAQDICRMYSVYYALGSASLIMLEQIEKKLGSKNMMLEHESKKVYENFKSKLLGSKVWLEDIERAAFSASRDESGNIDYIKSFDALRNDGNFFVRMVCEVYNASRGDSDIRLKVESMLKLATKEPIISYDIIDKFKMNDR